MSDLENYFENEPKEHLELKQFYKLKPSLTAKCLFKGIEISKQDFLLVFLIFNSLVFLIIGQFTLIGMTQMSPEKLDIITTVVIFNGLLIGFIVSIYIIDKIKDPISLMKYILAISLGITLIQFPIVFFDLIIVMEVLLFSNIFILIVAIMTICKIFLIITNILERGRVMAYLLIFTFVGIAIILSSLLFIYIVVIPIIFVILTIYFLQKNQSKYKMSFRKTNKKNIEKRFEKELIKYHLFFFYFSLTAGLATPFYGSLHLGYDIIGGNIILMFSIVLIFTIIISLVIGIIFDFFGRMGVLTYIILAIAIATYTFIFHFYPIDLYFAVVISAYIACFMSVPLLIGDRVTREYYGKALSISNLTIILGIIIGMWLRVSMPRFIEDEPSIENILNGSIFMSCIICFMLLLYMRETLPRKEQAWKDFIYYFYIIHDSGLLLYEHSFQEDKESNINDQVSSDLKAGGIIGVKTILKEIMRGQKEVKRIDQGDRILLINHSENVVFALVVKEELIVIRKKIEAFIEDFNASFSEFTKDIGFSGVDMRIFKPIEQLAVKHFGQ